MLMRLPWIDKGSSQSVSYINSLTQLSLGVALLFESMKLFITVPTFTTGANRLGTRRGEDKAPLWTDLVRYLLFSATHRLFASPSQPIEVSKALWRGRKWSFKWFLGHVCSSEVARRNRIRRADDAAARVTVLTSSETGLCITWYTTSRCPIET